MKKKANGQYRARITARGFLQQDGIHYFSHSTSAPVANELTIKTALTLFTIAGWEAQVIDVKGEFLKGKFKDGEKLYLKIPQGFENYYNNDEVLYLKRTIYGLKQSAVAFWNELLEAFTSMGFQRSKADPCLYYKNTTNGLVLWISWVDDCILMGHPDGVKHYHTIMNEYFDCDNIGGLKEYVGCKIERSSDKTKILLSQPVIIRSFMDEFNVIGDKKTVLPASKGDVFIPASDQDQINKEEQKIYRSGVGKLLYLARWS
jgi:hypothetical protein